MLKKDITAQLDAMGISYNPTSKKEDLLALIPTPKEQPKWEQPAPTAVQINGTPLTLRPGSREEAIRLCEMYREQNPKKYARKKAELERRYGITL